MPRKPNYTPKIPPKAASTCKGPGCGIVLYDDPADIPYDWIIIWHVNCDGYCPECAIDMEIGGCGQDRAEYILGEYAYWESHKNGRAVIGESYEKVRN